MLGLVSRYSCDTRGVQSWLVNGKAKVWAVAQYVGSESPDPTIIQARREVTIAEIDLAKFDLAERNLRIAVGFVNAELDRAINVRQSIQECFKKIEVEICSSP